MLKASVTSLKIFARRKDEHNGRFRYASARLIAPGLEHFRARDILPPMRQEEVWRDLNGHRRIFWQAMIHLVVGAYHFTNGNLRGCQGTVAQSLTEMRGPDPKVRRACPKSLTCLRDMVRGGLAMVEGGSDPLAHLEAFATSVVSEDWFTLI